MHDFRSSVPLPPIEPVALIATTYEPGAVWAPVVLQGARAALPLLDHLFTASAEPERALRLAASLAPGIVTLQGPRPDAAEVASAILGFVDLTLDGMAPHAALADVSQRAAHSPSAAEVVDDPGWVPVAVKVQQGRVRFRHYERPFHIGRAIHEPRPWDAEFSLDEIEAAAAPLRDPAKVLYVYHHGYAGSTLLARLLDRPGTCLVYAEPNVHSGRYSMPAMRRLCYRTFSDQETPLVKALPHEIVHAAQHLDDHRDARALFLFAPVEEYVASILAHAYRRKYVVKMAHTLGAPADIDAADAAVHCWERIADEALAVAATHPLRTLASEAFFTEPVAVLEATWEWFGFAPRADWDATLSTVASTHSKQGQPFTFTARLTQRAEYDDGAHQWREDHGTVIERARATAAALARFSL
jgi:hypothetical protein